MTRPGMREWALGARGRIVTWPAPDAYVLVEGVLLRMGTDIPGMAPGTEVVVGLDAEGRTLVAHGTTPGERGRVDRGRPRTGGPAIREDGGPGDE
ncbi:hypothetical protein AB0P17_26925 [Streptomyces sp. NPDC088124]|uniref:hypothetical protein n=1 Tax=Streptomyces sp. NPDC088124 TaxID=3154654 RepID=UPI00344A6E3E